MSAHAEYTWAGRYAVRQATRHSVIIDCCLVTIIILIKHFPSDCDCMSHFFLPVVCLGTNLLIYLLLSIDQSALQTNEDPPHNFEKYSVGKRR